jgi:cell wall-associated NlpC family hydrolase
MKLALGIVGILLAASAFSQGGKALGKYGQAIEDSYIYRTPNSKGRPYCKIKKFSYLIVNAYTERYTKVVMQNGAVGYVRADKVVILPENVYQASQPEAPQSQGNRGDLASRGQAAMKGLNYVGKTRYVWGGNDINNGIDCSAFVKKLYGEIGISLPRTAAEQAKVGTKITRLEDLQPGDRLYFWEKKRGTVGHTGMYLGNGYFVHSSRGHDGVATDYLTDKWLKILVAARR